MECAEEQNLVYTDCGSSCPPTCEDWNQIRKFCKSKCVSGCECKPGFFLTDDVEAQDGMSKIICPKKNQVYNKCGTGCPLTCRDWNKLARNCHAMCFVGCQCAPGFFLDDKNECINPNLCPYMEKKNEELDYYY
ncbi:BMP-binding endothelial regulator protein-like [Ctenocephalides felis]|uniref:BMP-binding endothelial regulator protein-like n=1 Tax=Ctenocephalides felis TaxID=7515 RepID=UPI000E6E30E2|nr:BMP-binding endothelial regulator protein-like [Ctenocephalides felis]